MPDGDYLLLQPDTRHCHIAQCNLSLSRYVKCRSSELLPVAIGEKNQPKSSKETSHNFVLKTLVGHELRLSLFLPCQEMKATRKF